MKKLCLLLLTVVFIFQAFAQTEKGYIYLKNGSILKGKFKYSDDFNKIQVLSAGNIWIFEATEVDSVTGLRQRKNQYLTYNNQSSSFFVRTEIGVLAGNSANSQTAPFSFSSSVNYQIQPLISIGIGGGLEFLKESYFPAFLNLEYKWRNLASSPYLFLKSGYLLPLSESNEIYYYDYQPWSSIVRPGYGDQFKAKGGFLVNPGLGYQWMYSQNLGMSFAFGYQFHRLLYKGENDYGLDIDYNRLTIKLGIIFN